MAVDPATNPVDSLGGPWSFSRALECMRAGGMVRRRSWQMYVLKGYGIRISGGAFVFASMPTATYPISAADVLADNWEMVSALAPEGG